MTRMLVSLLLGYGLATNADALSPASPSDQASIQTHLTQAAALQGVADAADRSLQKVEQGLKANPYDKNLMALSDQYRDAKRAAMRERDLERDKAIHLTLTAYGLVAADPVSGKPTMPSGNSVSAGYSGQIAAWRPVAGDDVTRRFSRPDGSTFPIGPFNKPSIRAYTLGNGVTVVFAGAFASPDYLALVLAHEKHHFDQNLMPGIGDAMSTNEREVLAWKQTKGDIDLIGISGSDRTHLISQATNTIAAYEKDVASEKWKQKWSGGLWKPGGISRDEPLMNPSDRDFLVERFDDMSDIVARELAVAKEEAHRQKREDDERRERASMPAELHPTFPDLPQQPAPLSPGRPSLPQGPVNAVAGRPGQETYMMALMRSIADNACAAPPAPFESVLAGLDWSRFGLIASPEGAMANLGSCQSGVMRTLIDFGRGWRPGQTLGAEAIRAAVASGGGGIGGGAGSVPPTQSHDPVWGRVRPLLPR